MGAKGRAHLGKETIVRFMRKMRPWLFALAVLLLAVSFTALLAACEDDEEEEGTATGTPAARARPSARARPPARQQREAR